MPAPAALHDLVSRFREQHLDYKGGRYNETQLRRDFLDPLFRLLGWDVDNRAGYAETFREVVHEDAVKVGGTTKAPDYSFRLGGRRLFFLEAKKPSVYIKVDFAPAYQLRRYAWSAGLQLSILSDFEEFAVYDGSLKPGPKDKPAKARGFYCTFEDYAAKWDEIATLFSKEAVLKGSLERFIKKLPGRRGTATVDAEFLAQIETWREVLARNIALRNTSLDVHALNHAVQATIDRIIFLRICEDRGIEPEGRLLGLTNGGGIYPRLTQVFRDADDRYNSGLFHFKTEKKRPGVPDEFTLALAVDDKPLRDIIRGLYYPESPYEFSVLPADILGSVYPKAQAGTLSRNTPGRPKCFLHPLGGRAGQSPALGALRAREGGKWNHELWHAFGRTQYLVEMDAPKLVVQVISQTGRYAYDDAGCYFTGGGNGPYYGVRWKPAHNIHSLLYLSGLLNSRLLDACLHRVSSPFRGGYWSYGKRFIEQVPTRVINPNIPAAKTAHDKTLIQRQMDAIDKRIDALVYELYELSHEEIRLLEGTAP